MLKNSAEGSNVDGGGQAAPIPVQYAVPVGPPTQQQQAAPGQEQHFTYHQQQTDNIPNATVIHVIHHQQPEPVFLVNDFGQYPTRTVCQYCGADVVTNVASRPSLAAHIWALGLCVFGCWPCCVLPYLMNDCQAQIHTCPNCNREVAFHGL